MDGPPGTAFQRAKGFDMAVLGGGVAGLTAAWHGARLGLSVALLEKSGLYGGQIATLGEIDDFATIGHVSGPDLAASLLDAAASAGAASTDTEVRALDRDGDGRWTIHTPNWSLRARSVVVATGAALRMLDVPNAAALKGRGVSQCATCDGGFCRNRDVVVVGGGDAALQEAMTLAKLCRRVTVVVRARLRARQAYIDAAAKCANLTFRWDSVVSEVLGADGVEGVRLRHVKTAAEDNIECFAVFPFIGSIPQANFLPSQIKRTSTGHILVEAGYNAAPGLYAIGAVRQGFSGALSSAAGEGAAVAAAIAQQIRK